MSSEDEEIVAWEEEQSKDIRHLFKDPLPSMTQQIHALGSSSDSDEDVAEPAENGHKKAEASSGDKSPSRRRSPRLQLRPSASAESAARKRRSARRTPPLNSSGRRSKDLSPDDAPATISKLRRKRRLPADRGAAGNRDHDEQLDTSGNQMSATQEVDRLFDLLYGSQKCTTNTTTTDTTTTDTTTTNTTTTDTVNCSQDNANNAAISDANKGANNLVNSGSDLACSPITQRRLFNNPPHSRERQRRRLRQSLQPQDAALLRPNFPELLHGRPERFTEPEQKDMACNPKEESQQEEDGQDIWKEIEITLDRVHNATKNGPMTENTAYSFQPMENTGITVPSNKTTTGNDEQTSTIPSSRLVRAVHPISPSKSSSIDSISSKNTTHPFAATNTITKSTSAPSVKQWNNSIRNNNISNNKTNNNNIRNNNNNDITNNNIKKNTHNSSHLNTRNNTLSFDEYSSMEFDDQALAAMDAQVASMAERYTIPQTMPQTVPTTTSTTKPSTAISTASPTKLVSNPNINNHGNSDDEFGHDDWNEEDLATIDHLANNALSQSNLLTQPHNPPLQQNKLKAAGEFSDDDFDEVDFDALDQIVKQHPLSQPYPGPVVADGPIRNRRRNSIDATQMQQNLSFTRYIVRDVLQNASSFTKTLCVQRWTPSELKHADELERLYKLTQNVSNPTSIDGHIHLRGEWYDTPCQPGDVVHLCSISGIFSTDVLPVVLHTNPPAGSDAEDDLVLVIHPDMFITPTLVSEAVRCPRLAVLQSRLGSTGLSAKSAVIGTLRHDLFERCLREHDASRRSAMLYIRQILRNRADSLVGCGITHPREAFSEVLRTLPQIQSFLRTYSSFVGKGTPTQNGTTSGKSLLNGIFASNDILLSMGGVYSTEEWAMVPELGLKGNVDATLLALTKPVNSNATVSGKTGAQAGLMALELKTGHLQSPQHSHLAQLSVYTLMLRARHGSTTATEADLHANVAIVASNKSNPVAKQIVLDGVDLGASKSGLLLYLNHESYCAKHVEPSLSEAKALISQRNGVASNILNAARPRGVVVKYEEESEKTVSRDSKRKSTVIISPPPPTALPSLLPSAHSCERCYKNRECMMYASADTIGNELSINGQIHQVPTSHSRLISHFTAHLTGEDLQYFRKWDRLIDLEKHASHTDIAKSWLMDSREKEAKDGKCISSLLLDGAMLSSILNNPKKTDEEDTASLRFYRVCDAKKRTPLMNLNFETGSYVIVSTDSSSDETITHSNEMNRRAARRKMHMMRGSVGSITENSIDIIVSKRDITRAQHILQQSCRNGHSRNGTNEQFKFRLDKDELFSGAGLLLQNLVNFFTLDIEPFSAESMTQKQIMSNAEGSARRRRLNSFVVHLAPPPRFLDVTDEAFFATNAHSLVPGCDRISLKRDFDNLNSDQKGAVRKVMSAEDFALIQGLPGTGKSATIAFLTRLLVAQGKRVLLTSYTHSAVDNLFSKLIDSGVQSSSVGQSHPIVRIGREASCHLKVQPLLAEKLACKMERLTTQSDENSGPQQPNVDYLYKVVSSASVVGVSALTAPRSPLLAGQHFDVVIVDEAGQISQPAVLGVMMAADLFVLVGDHMQLPPLVCSEAAEQAGYGVSMLMRLAEGFPSAVAQLTMQYRMHEDICHLSNVITYKGLLKCGNDKVRYETINLRNFPLDSSKVNHIDKIWLEQAIAPDRPVVFLDTDELKSQSDSSGHQGLESDVGLKETGGLRNLTEVLITRRIVIALSVSGLNVSSVGVITPFRSQLRILNEDPTLKELKIDGLELCTIDRFQGRDKPVIIVSFVRSNEEGKAGRLLQDFRRLNVSFSRAKQKLIMIGSFSTLSKGSDVIRPVLESIRDRNWIYTISGLS